MTGLAGRIKTLTFFLRISQLFNPERRHGSTRLPGHAFLACRIAHDGWFCVHFLYITAARIPSARRFAVSIRATGTVRKRQPVRPVHHVQITPAGSLSSSQSGGPPCGTSPLAFALIGFICIFCLFVFCCTFV